MMLMKTRSLFVAVLFFSMFFSLNAQLEEKKSQVPEDNWDKSLTLYIFMPNMELTPTLDGTTPSEPIYIDFPDFVDNADELRAFSGKYEMWKKWGFLFKIDYVKVENKLGSGPVTADIKDLEQLLLDVAVGYTLGEFPLNGLDQYPYLRLITWAGLQYNYLDQEVDVTITPDLPGSESEKLSLGGDDSWFEPFVGLGAHLVFTENIELALRGQAGGFGIDDATDENWWIIAVMNYSFTDQWSASFGYKYWKFDYMDDDETIGLDAIFQGPLLGVTYHF